MKIKYLKLASFLILNFLTPRSFAMEQAPLRYWFWWPIRTYDTFEADTPPVMQLARTFMGRSFPVTLVANLRECWRKIGV